MLPRYLSVMAVVLLVAAGSAHGTTYTSDPNVNDFTRRVKLYGTFIQDSDGDVAVPFTPTAATVSAGLRVVGDGAITPIIVQFPQPVSDILVFPSIDHFGDAYDGFQYSIAGSNDGMTWTPLFDALSVNGASEPFTLGSFTGTPPLTVNNVLTPGAGAGGTVGYEAEFHFGQAYRYFSFASSTVANDAGNPDEELSAVGALPLAPAPTLSSVALMVLTAGLCLLGAYRIKRRRASNAS